jgi:AraC-like DNA-binding protein
VDLLQEHLIRARAAGGVFARSAANPPWGLRLSGIQLAVHAVIQGQVWLWTETGEEAVPLRPGDLAFVRGGADHFVAHEPGAVCVSPDEFRRLYAGGDVELGAQEAVFLCGAYQFAGDIGAGLVDALPPVLAFPASVDDPIHGVVTMLSREMAHPRPGQQTVLDRLLDVLVVLGLRTGLARSSNAPAWFRAAADERLSRALQAIHENAGRPWTVEKLARVALMSRASFARVFQRTLGQTPMQYLSDWRMTLARDLLLTDGLSLAQIAERVGYSSQYAFATAFRRHHGEPPGRWRQHHALNAPAVLVAH